jgi:hypothetical protein
MDELDKQKHPQGLSPKDRECFHTLVDMLFVLYDRMPLNEDPEKFRKLISGCGENDATSHFILFKGSKEEHFKITNFIKNDL